MWPVYVILIPVAAAALVTLITVLLARFAMRPSGPPVLEVIGPDTNLSPNAATSLDELQTSLAALGLQPLGRVRVRGGPHVTAYATALASDDGLVIGQGVLHALNVGGRERILSRCVEFSTRLEKGAVLLTSNADRHALVDRLASYWRFPLCRDAAALLRIHRAVIAADGRPALKLKPAAAAWVSRLTEDGDQLWRALEDAGLVRRAGARRGRTHGWRYTWRFAVCEAAGSLWPMSRWREREDRREAKALLETVWLGALWKTGRQ